MMSSARIAGVVALCALVGAGCYSKRIYELETRADETDWRMTTLADSVRDAQAGVAHLDSLVGTKSVPSRSSGALMQSRIDDLETRVEMLESLVKETRTRMSQLSMGGPKPSAPDTAGLFPDTTSAPSAVAQDIYENAYVDFVKGDYQSAISGFRDFVNRFPANDFSDDAQFMIGQSYFATGDYAGSIREFRRVLDRYPSGDRVPQAMYSLGVAYLKVGDEETAREYFRILGTRYPKAPESERAKAFLDSLGTQGTSPDGR